MLFIYLFLITLILHSLCKTLPSISYLWLSGQNLYEFLISPMRSTSPSHLTPLYSITLMIWGKEHKLCRERKIVHVYAFTHVYNVCTHANVVPSLKRNRIQFTSKIVLTYTMMYLLHLQEEAPCQTADNTIDISALYSVSHSECH
jgi:hypothetical protein